MSDNERMERAKRIRRMREGDRDGTESETEENGNGSTAPTATSPNDSAQQTVESPISESDGEAAEQAERDSPIAEQDSGTEGAESATESQPSMEGTESVIEASTRSTGTETASSETDSSGSDADSSGETAQPSGDVKAPLPDAEQLEQALEGTAAVEPDTEEVPESSEADPETTEEEETRVLEFTLDDEHYCLDITYIEEIVKQETITRVPNTPEFVEGVVDLRGQITTILNPKVTLEKENNEAGDLIVVFDGEAFEDQGYIGWIVDDVRQVAPITESEVNDPPMQEDYINGVVDRDEDDEFVIWTTPDLALEEAS